MLFQLLKEVTCFQHKHPFPWQTTELMVEQSRLEVVHGRWAERLPGAGHPGAASRGRRHPAAPSARAPRSPASQASFERSHCKLHTDLEPETLVPLCSHPGGREVRQEQRTRQSPRKRRTRGGREGFPEGTGLGWVSAKGRAGHEGNARQVRRGRAPSPAWALSAQYWKSVRSGTGDRISGPGIAHTTAPM